MHDVRKEKEEKGTQEEENVGHAEALIINSGIVPKEKESLEDSKAKEKGEKDSKEEKEQKEEKGKDASTVETHGIMPESAHIQKGKEEEHQLTNLPKGTTS